MGAGQSIAQDDVPSKGLHVLRVTPSSPAAAANIEPFFDFVVGFEGDSRTSQTDINVTELERIVESHENKVLKLLIWNAKSRQARGNVFCLYPFLTDTGAAVPIIPSRAWSQQHLRDGSASPTAQPSLLGLSMRVCHPDSATENVWHVLDVLEGSPAESAGLVPMGDWILGTFSMSRYMRLLTCL